jgi:hypothetical protein
LEDELSPNHQGVIKSRYKTVIGGAMKREVIVAEDDDRGAQTLHVMKGNKRIARIQSLVSGAVCTVFVPPSSKVPINSEPLSRNDAVNLAYNYKKPKASNPQPATQQALA